jgi:hypothetical protein
VFSFEHPLSVTKETVSLGKFLKENSQDVLYNACSSADQREALEQLRTRTASRSECSVSYLMYKVTCNSCIDLLTWSHTSAAQEHYLPCGWAQVLQWLCLNPAFCLRAHKPRVTTYHLTWMQWWVWLHNAITNSKESWALHMVTKHPLNTIFTFFDTCDIWLKKKKGRPIFYFIFLVALGFELRTSCLLGGWCYCLSHSTSPPLFYDYYFRHCFDKCSYNVYNTLQFYKIQRADAIRDASQFHKLYRVVSGSFKVAVLGTPWVEGSLVSGSTSEITTISDNWFMPFSFEKKKDTIRKFYKWLISKIWDKKVLLLVKRQWNHTLIYRTDTKFTSIHLANTLFN